MHNKNLNNILSKYENHPDFMGETISNVNQKGGFDDTVLHIAARKNAVDHILCFLEHGANINAKGDMGFTPLHYACMNGNYESIKILLENGADKLSKNEFNQTALDIVKSIEPENRKKIIDLLTKSIKKRKQNFK